MTRFITLLLVLLPIYSFAQLYDNSFEQYLQQTKVGLVDEFIKRFNGTETHPNLLSRDENTRKNNLLLLLDLSKYSSKEDSSFIKVSEMLDCAIKDSVSLHYNDSTWFAIAHCKGLMHKKEVSFDLYLNVEQKSNELYKWVITYAEGEIFNSTPKSKNDKIMLYPDDHETNFISLMHMTHEQPRNVCLFMDKNFTYDATSVFAYLVYSKQLTISYVDKLEFVFTQIPGYIFHVENIERNTENSGWLITQFYKSSDEEKDKLFSKLKGIQYTSPSQNKQVENKSDTVKNTFPSINKEDIKARILEQIHLIKDYINFIRNNEDIESQEYYQAKLKDLFNAETKITLRDKRNKVIGVMNLADFCAFMSTYQKGKIRIDSVSIPLINDTIHSVTDTIHSVVGYLLPIECVESDLFPQPQKLNLVLEQTEDSAEWIPELGNMVITISKQ